MHHDEKGMVVGSNGGYVLQVMNMPSNLFSLPSLA